MFTHVLLVLDIFYDRFFLLLLTWQFQCRHGPRANRSNISSLICGCSIGSYKNPCSIKAYTIQILAHKNTKFKLIYLKLYNKLQILTKPFCNIQHKYLFSCCYLRDHFIYATVYIIGLTRRLYPISSALYTTTTVKN